MYEAYITLAVYYTLTYKLVGQEFVTVETTRKLGRVIFRKDVWDCYWERSKNWPITDRRVVPQ